MNNASTLAAYGTEWARGQPQQIEYVNAEMERLERYYGLWSVTERHFDERGQSVGVEMPHARQVGSF